MFSPTTLSLRILRTNLKADCDPSPHRPYRKTATWLAGAPSPNAVEPNWLMSCDCRLSVRIRNLRVLCACPIRGPLISPSTPELHLFGWHILYQCISERGSKASQESGSKRDSNHLPHRRARVSCPRQVSYTGRFQRLRRTRSLI